jgi:hypothetical protein
LICQIRNVKLQITLEYGVATGGCLASAIYLAAAGVNVTQAVYQFSPLPTINKPLSNQPADHLGYGKSGQISKSVNLNNMLVMCHSRIVVE